jgi:uncharacterized membrane protein YeaQ/YmgE (transglycosylase-associated protein family)
MSWFQIISSLIANILYNIKKYIFTDSVRTYFKHVSGMFMYMVACVIGASLATIIMQSILVR